MIKNIKIIQNFSKEERYKICISITFGIFSCLSFLYSLKFPYDSIKFNINWGIIFPFLVSISWGGVYGIISAVMGLAAFFPLLSCNSNNLIYYIFLLQTFICILFQSFGAQRRIKSNKFYYNTYFIQIIYVLLCILIYMNIYNYSSLTRSHEINIVMIRDIISELMMISICSTLLLIPIVRKLFLFKVSKYSKDNYKIIGLAITMGAVCFVIVEYVYHSMIDMNYTLRWILKLEFDSVLFLYLLFIFVLVALSKIVQVSEKRIERESLIIKGEVKYRNIFNNFYDLYFETDLEGRIKVISPSVKDILGYEMEGILNKNIKELYLELSRREIFIDAITKEKKITNFEILFIHKNGKFVMISINAKISMDEDGKPIIIGVGRDVSEVVEARKLQRKNEEKYKSLFNRMLSGLFIFEPIFDEKKNLIDFTFIDINPGFEKHAAVKREDALGKRWTDVFGYTSKNLHIYNRILKSGKSEEFEGFDSKTNEYHFNYAFKINDSRVGVIFKNITKDKNAMSEIKKLNEELEYRVEERTNELKIAMEELEAFNYTVSHDLKSPLRAIDGYISIIEEEYGENLENNLDKMLKATRKICDDMIILINKLLNYSTTSKLDIFKEPINMKDLFIEVFNELKSSNLEMKINLTIDTELPVVMADRILLKQVVYNLLSNSIKFTKHKITALINIGCKESKGEYIFYVKDNGVGFDMEYSSKLFGIFQRMHSQDEFEGTGVGLATVRKIILKHGGRAWIEGKVNCGAIVYFTLSINN